MSTRRFHAALTLLVTLCNLRAGESTRGEASLAASDSFSSDLSGREVEQRCEEAVQHSHSASETIQALQKCIEDLERYSSQSKAAHSEAKESTQTYASDVNIIGSFLQSLQTKLANPYKKHQEQYNNLREDQHEAFSGFLEKLSTMQGSNKGQVQQNADSRGATPRTHRTPRMQNHLHQAERSSAFQQNSKMLKEALQKVAKRRHRRPNDRAVPSLLQISSQDGEDNSQNTNDGQDETEVEDAWRARLMPTSLLQLQAEDAVSGAAEAAATGKNSRLLEQEVSNIAKLFWKPWKPLEGGEKPALQNMVGIGFTEEDAAARTAVISDALHDDKEEAT